LALIMRKHLAEDEKASIHDLFRCVRRGGKELTRWPLERALDLMRKGKLKPRIETVTRATLD